MWGYTLWAEDTGLDKMRCVPSGRKHAFNHCLLLLCHGPSVTRYLKLLVLTSPTVTAYHLQTWAERNPFPLSHFYRTISSQQHKGDEDTGIGATRMDSLPVRGRDKRTGPSVSPIWPTQDIRLRCGLLKDFEACPCYMVKTKREKKKNTKTKNLQLYCVIDKGCL